MILVNGKKVEVSDVFFRGDATVGTRRAHTNVIPTELEYRPSVYPTIQ